MVRWTAARQERQHWTGQSRKSGRPVFADICANAKTGREGVSLVSLVSLVKVANTLLHGQTAPSSREVLDSDTEMEAQPCADAFACLPVELHSPGGGAAGSSQGPCLLSRAQATKGSPLGAGVS